MVKEMNDEKPTDHSPFFILGISLIAVGISQISAVGPAFISFIGFGVVFMAIGMINRNKWVKSEKETV